MLLVWTVFHQALCFQANRKEALFLSGCQMRFTFRIFPLLLVGTVLLIVCGNFYVLYRVCVCVFAVEDQKELPSPVNPEVRQKEVQMNFFNQLTSVFNPDVNMLSSPCGQIQVCPAILTARAH